MKDAAAFVTVLRTTAGNIEGVEVYSARNYRQDSYHIVAADGYCVGEDIPRDGQVTRDGGQGARQGDGASYAEADAVRTG